MARPKKDEDKRRTTEIKVRLTEQEKEEFKRIALAYGYSNVSEFLRDSVFYRLS